VGVGEPQRGGRLTVAFPGTPGQFDPGQVIVQEDFAVVWGAYNGLIWVDHTLTPQPELASSWAPSEDLTTWTFELRQGIRFHHGTEFTAEDVVYTFERILDPDLASPLRSPLSFLDRVELVDTYTARFHLNSANADLPLTLGAVQARIVPHDRTVGQLEQDPTGTGPFKLADYEPGTHVRMVRNEDYWEEGLPYLEEVRQVYMPEEATQIAALTGGSIDMMWQLGFENLPQIEGHPDTVLGEARSGLYQPIVMRVTDEPFTDNRVRQALKLCVDRQDMRQAVSLGRGDLGNDQPIPPVNPFWADLPIPERDIERARALLADAGYADGLDVTLHTSPVRPGLIEQAVAFQEMAKPAGVNVEIRRVPTDVYWAETWMKVPLFMSNWNLRASTDEHISIAYHSEADWNEHNWKSPELDRLIEAARGEGDEERRAELYAEAQSLLSEQGGVIIAFFKPIIMATRKEVGGFQPHPSSWINLRDTWLTEQA
jgi:peptide/nickel transport system substrate-binding protein